MKANESIIKWKNIPITRKQLEEARALKEKADKAYEQKKKDILSSEMHKGWSEQTRRKMLMAEIAQHKPITMRQAVNEVIK